MRTGAYVGLHIRLVKTTYCFLKTTLIFVVLQGRPIHVGRTTSHFVVLKGPPICLVRTTFHFVLKKQDGPTKTTRWSY